MEKSIDTLNASGVVFDIQHFSVSDGPGIRTVVFLKGCPLRCSWCHNPESYRFAPQVMAYRERCIGCGACAAACHAGIPGLRGMESSWREKCTACGNCASVCPAQALEVAGKTMTALQVLEEVLEDEPFYRTSSGGLTLSGGEPMAQFSFALAIAKEAKAHGLSLCMETSGFSTPANFLAIQPYVDVFLYDYKLTGDEEHRLHTSVDQQQILENLRILDENGAEIILRCPMIPGVNIHPEHEAGIIRTANSLRHLQQIHLEPYHNIGLSKRTRLGMEVPADTAPPDRQLLREMARRIAEKTGRETLVM